MTDPVTEVARQSETLLTVLNQVVGATLANPPRAREARAVIEAVVLVDFRLQTITDEIQNLLHTDGVMVIILDEKKAEVVVMSGAEVLHSLVLEADKEAPPGVNAYCKYCMASLHTFVVTDSRLAPMLQGHPYVDLVRGYLGAPLVINEQCVGALCATSQSPRAWTEEDAAMMVRRAQELSDILESALERYHYRDG